MSADAVRAALAAPLSSLGVDVEDVEIARAGRRHVVRVVVDRDGGVDLDTVADVSRMVSELLDAEPLASAVPGPYTLEVTSPGVDRPLTQARHWRRARGRLVSVERADGTTAMGRITGSTDAAVVIEVDGREQELAYADIARAVVQVEFAKASAQESADGGADGAADDEEGGR